MPAEHRQRVLWFLQDVLNSRGLHIPAHFAEPSGCSVCILQAALHKVGKDQPEKHGDMTAPLCSKGCQHPPPHAVHPAAGTSANKS